MAGLQKVRLVVHELRVKCADLRKVKQEIRR